MNLTVQNLSVNCTLSLFIANPYRLFGHSLGRAFNPPRPMFSLLIA
jgi:hypothetical protein